MSKIKLIFIFLFFSVAIFLIRSAISRNNDQSTTEVFFRKTYKMAIDEDLRSIILPKIEEFFKENKKDFKICSESEAEIIISKSCKNIPNNEEIISLYSPLYERNSYNIWYSQKTAIYFCTFSNNHFQNKLKEYLQSFFVRNEWNFLAVGDIMLARNVGKKMIEGNNWNLPFLKTVDILKSGEIAFANLESPFAQEGQKIFSGMIFGADPKAVRGLVFAGFDIVSLANNHFGNQGKSGMNYTFQLLKQNKIEYVGAGENFIEAHKAKILKVNDIKVAFLAYDGVDSTPQSYTAQDNSPGLAKWNIEQLKRDILETRRLNPDVLVISMHAGTEYTYQPRADQIDFAHAAIDAGADLVLGHHPHCLQKIEKYRDRLIFYSLGNFVFDQMWSEQTKEGIILKITFYGSNIKLFSLIPVYITDYNQPQIVSEEKGEKILSHILPNSNF